MNYKFIIWSDWIIETEHLPFRCQRFKLNTTFVCMYVYTKCKFIQLSSEMKMLWCKPMTISVTMLSSVDSKHGYVDPGFSRTHCIVGNLGTDLNEFSGVLHQ